MSWSATPPDRVPLRIVFAAIGSRGDVQPLVALALEARSRGHTVRLAAPVNFEGWVRSHGLDFSPFGDDVQELLADDPALLTGSALKLLRSIATIGREHAGPQLRQLMQACEGADLLVWAGIALVAPTAAEALRIPALNVLYSSCWMPSSGHPPPVVHVYGWPRWAYRALWAIDGWLGAIVFAGMLGPLRKELRLPRRNLQRQFFVDGHHVIAADETLFPSDRHWDPRRTPRANFIFLEDRRPLDAELDAWLRDGPPPIFTGFGSMSGRGPRQAMQALVEALAGSGQRCIVGAGWAQLEASGLPAGWRVIGDVPHAQLFPRVALVIHHGGSGTMATVLRAGVPQVILPLLLDQYHHAHLLHRAGIAPRPVPMEKVTGPLLAASIAQALVVPREELQAVAARVRGSDATARVIDIAEQVARGA